MSSKWMRFNRDTLLDGLGAFIVAAVLSVLFFGDQLPNSALGAKLPEPKLVPYYVSWHATLRRSDGDQRSTPEGATDTRTERHSADAAGSAVTRFRQNQDGSLEFQDTHYLTFTQRKNWDMWERHTFQGFDCTGHISRTIADPGSYAGYRAVNNQTGGGLLLSPPKQRNGVTVMRGPFGSLALGLGPNAIIEHYALDMYGHVPHFDNNDLTGFDPCPSPERSTWDGDDPGYGVLHEIDLQDPRLDLQADPTDPSSFSLHARYSVLWGLSEWSQRKQDIEVEWTAHATLMGKCAERAGPIQESDPVVQNEDVRIDTDDSEITPEGKTKVRIRVTCDQVAIKDADVEVTVKPVNESGGHYHVSKRLRGRLGGADCGDLTNNDPCVTPKTDEHGEVVDDKHHQKGLTFVPPGQTTSCRCVGLAGIYEVTAKSRKFPDRKDTAVITVKYKGLTSKLLDDEATESGIAIDTTGSNTVLGSYYDIRSYTNAHPGGTYGKPSTVSAFQSVAKEFYQLQVDHNSNLANCKQTEWPKKKVSFNDIALRGGGLFDLGPSDKNPGHPWWQPGHQTHGKGEGGDFNHFYETSTLTECNGAQRNFDTWLWSNLKALGEKYGGAWDQADLNNGNLWHLHMDDAGVKPPGSCPNDKD